MYWRAVSKLSFTNLMLYYVKYSHTPRNDILVHNGPHIRWW